MGVLVGLRSHLNLGVEVGGIGFSGFCVLVGVSVFVGMKGTHNDPPALMNVEFPIQLAV
jgi:hypothetical protein